MSELDELLGKKDPVTPEAPLDAPKDDEVLSKEQQLANLNKAIREANETLRATRKAAKGEAKDEDDDTPQIDLTDPSAKAWDKHIKSQVDPFKDESEREKEEIFNYAFKQFAEDKPILINNPERRAAFLEKYEKLKSSTGRTKEGVLADLETAFGAEFNRELIQRAYEKRVAEAKADALFSDPAVSRSSAASYRNENTETIKLTDEDKAILAKWGMSEAEFIETKKKYN